MPLPGRLGRLPAARDPRVPRMGDFVKAPAPVDEIRWGAAVASWPMALNDRLGCCTIAGVAHAKQMFGVIGGAERVMSDAEVEAGYRRFGYVPRNPASDQGAVEEDVLRSWMQDGFVIGGVLDRIEAYASIPLVDVAGVMTGLSVFGAVYLGVVLPAYVREQDVWHVPAAPSAADLAPLGGHCVLAVEAEPPTGPDACLTVVTWGARQRVTWGWWLACGEEAHVIDHPDWTRAGSLSGVDRAGLRAAMAALA